MQRTPSENVQSVLRREVNYGCPFPNCCIPFLQFHHFDPPWHKEEHMRPDGMIALCALHHASADRNVYSVAQLREFKSRPNPIPVVRARFDWLMSNAMYRFGSCYACDDFVMPRHSAIELDIPWIVSGGIVSVPDPIQSAEQLISLRRSLNETTDISMLLNSVKQSMVVRIVKNCVEIDTLSIDDLKIACSGHAIKVWTQKREVGLDLSYARINLSRFEKIVSRDEQASYERLVKRHVALELTPDWVYERLRSMPLPDAIDWAKKLKRNVGAMVTRWHAARKLDEGHIPLFNLKGFRSYDAGRALNAKKDHFSSVLGNLEMCFVDFPDPEVVGNITQYGVTNGAPLMLDDGRLISLAPQRAKSRVTYAHATAIVNKPATQFNPPMTS
ncbi:MAG: hypothetical protein H7144_12870 [Burkholderiales bacterium]|nr:hypothetical protein [Phycisphaerae bacterium]